MFNVHKKFNMQLQCTKVIVNYIKISFCLRCMGHTNTYHGMNCYIASSWERKCDTRDFDPLFWVYMITLPLVQPIITMQFLIILGSIFQRNPPLNIDLLTTFILLIFYNIIFDPSHPHKIDLRSTCRTRTKLLTNKSQKGMYAIVLEERHMFPKQQYEKMIRSSGSRTTIVGMDAHS